MSTMTLGEAIKFLEEGTSLTFIQNEFNAQFEAKANAWRITIVNFPRDLDSDAEAVKMLCVRVTSDDTGWSTGQSYAVYSVQEGLLLISDWINGFLQFARHWSPTNVREAEL